MCVGYLRGVFCAAFPGILSILFLAATAIFFITVRITIKTEYQIHFKSIHLSTFYFPIEAYQLLVRMKFSHSR
ncbi:uncharacterized protein LY89DRAFT_60418 [Mollisia scopiformis]|uniref:Uncharacterized protein n=1 Tax=Mollisia scopiformis TaxID=149040 RepID=A0A194XC40_MOLSC|nr:uncharacterized protein LY89DRAFT_60418 [Mollisia scopiformis]KUJ17729.1 hypothetical protein LY89DRAFT_60418 [Mollisia scopiformis]